MKSKKKAKTTASSIPMVSYLTETKIELSKVTWPTRQQVVRLSGIVIATSIATGAYLGGLDYLFLNVVRFLLNQ